MVAWVVALAFLALAGGCFRSGDVGEDRETLRERIASDVGNVVDPETAFDDLRAIVVQVNGRTVFERFDESGPGDHHAVQSVTKSVISTLVGIAVGEGRLSLDSTLLELLPAYADRMKPRVADVTLRMVLTHTGGFLPEDEPDGLAFVDAADPVAAILARGTGPGEFAYSSAGAHLVSAILVEATGVPVLEYARAKLFDPLDIDTRPAAEPLARKANLAEYEAAGFAWPVDRAGLHLGWSFLKLTPVDLAKLGQLYLNKGEWQGRPVVSAAWVEAATTRQVSSPGGVMEGYGFLWWVGEVDEQPAYAAWGYGGQLVLVMPRQRLVVVYATELRFDDPSSRGISPSALLALSEIIVWQVAS